LIEVARILREEHDFRGYIHLKTIPEAAPELVAQAGLWADRVSINVELPTDAGLARLAPDKNGATIAGAMGSLSDAIVEAKDARKHFRSAPIFAPAGQSTQMIVGADGASDAQIVGKASTLYDRFALRRVYYSAFSPIPNSPKSVPLAAPPLMREHRLYQRISCCAVMAFAPMNCSPGRGIWRWISTPNWPGPWSIVRCSPWT